ncbi:hypothetical protein [Sphingomonas xinjiangensis]|uniref:Uncharacterized protein n=1 Tax=Sphingomonas xinjiangensis TaxID=643568 RepID=A0A840YF13_9SPHN|nr:hypothetical protein [Sphingomonas xinjiangensis]MBB5710895.1 hypothetical protein [Sphingomonas xinjiangensis]
MTQPIGVGRSNPVPLGSAQAAGSSPAALAGQAMSTIASRVATTIASELGLASGGAPRGFGRGGDRYDVNGVANDLAAVLGAGPADAGRLSRALGEFTSEIAALLAAKPHSSVLGMVSGLHFNLVDTDGRQGMDASDHACAAIEAAVFRLREDTPWTSAP